jgi:hypothetical protein
MHTHGHISFSPVFLACFCEIISDLVASAAKRLPTFIILPQRSLCFWFVTEIGTKSSKSLEGIQLSRYSDGLGSGWPEFDSRKGKEIFIYSTASIPSLELTRPPIQWVLTALSWGKVAGA